VTRVAESAARTKERERGASGVRKVLSLRAVRPGGRLGIIQKKKIKNQAGQQADSVYISHAGQCDHSLGSSQRGVHDKRPKKRNPTTKDSKKNEPRRRPQDLRS